MEGKKFFTDLRLIFSVIYSIYQFHFVVIIWTYIPTNLISVHLSVILTDLHLSENENLNVRNRCYRLQQPLDDRCTANKNGSLFVDIAILVTFLDKQHSSVQQCDQFICPAVLTFPAMNDRCVRLSESRPVQAFTGRINPALRHITGILLWSRTGRPFRPRRCHSLSSAVVAFLLLLSGDIESNPRPPSCKLQVKNLTSKPMTINCGTFNVHSAIRRSAIIHDLITDEQLDILALSETWMCTDTLKCIKRDIAPEGFSVLHVHRSGTAGRPWSGGGLAIIYRSTLDVSVHPRFEELCTSTSSCEIHLVRLGRASSSLTIANIYRPPGAMGDFYDDLATFISSICVEAGEGLLRCGDLNCADSQGLINDTLTNIFNAYSLRQYVEVPTRGDNILDVLDADDRTRYASQ